MSSRIQLKLAGVSLTTTHHKDKGSEPLEKITSARDAGKQEYLPEVVVGKLDGFAAGLLSLLLLLLLPLSNPVLQSVPSAGAGGVRLTGLTGCAGLVGTVASPEPDTHEQHHMRSRHRETLLSAS